MRDFFKKKFNIVLTIIQAIALFLMCLSSLHGVFMVLAIIVEGVFFITYGLKYFNENKVISKKNDLYNEIFGEDSNVDNEKKLSKSKKFNILKGIMFMCFGIVLIFLIVL